MTIETSAGERLLDDVEAALSRAEQVIEQVRFDALDEVVLALNEARTLLSHAPLAPQQDDTGCGDSERRLLRLGGIRARLGRLNELLSGAAAFYRGWAEQVTESAGYAENGRWHSLTAVAPTGTPARLRVEA